eukprot:263770-Pleurochrysis_carterae.AAC.1
MAAASDAPATDAPVEPDFLPIDWSLDASQAACRTAAAARLPNTLHTAFMSAVKKQKVLVQLGKGVIDVETEAAKRFETPRPRRKQKGKGDEPASDGKGGDGAEGDTAKPEKSGVPLGMQGWGEGKLDTCREAQLLLALVENSLSMPHADEKDKALFAKQQLMRRYEF